MDEMDEGPGCSATADCLKLFLFCMSAVFANMHCSVILFVQEPLDEIRCHEFSGQAGCQ